MADLGMMTRTIDRLDTQARPAAAPLVDTYQRRITYLRLSVTDRCDLRCTYCMPERMQFLPKAEVLSLEELYVLARSFMARGVRTIRLTGGEPLVRRDVIDLVRAIGRHVGSELDEVTLTTNGTQLAGQADALARAGVRRINVSLDTRDPQTFRTLSRRDALPQVLEGIAAAKDAGLQVKLNTVAMRSVNDAEIPDLVAWAHAQGHAISLIETMPLGDVDEAREDRFVSLADVRRDLESRWTLTPSDARTPGPSRYFEIARRAGRACIAGRQRPARFQIAADIGQRDEAILAGLVHVAQRHGLDQADRVALRMRPGDEIGNLSVVHAAHRHGVELDLQPRILRRGNPFEHLRQGIAARQCAEGLRIARIERDVNPPHARPRQRIRLARQLRAVGGQRHLVQLRPNMAADRAHEIDDVAAHQRFAPGQPDRAHTARHEAARQHVQFFEREHLGLGKELHPLGHAIGTAQIAAIGDRQAQIGDSPLIRIDQRRSRRPSLRVEAINRPCHHPQVGHRCRSRKGHCSPAAGIVR